MTPIPIVDFGLILMLFIFIIQLGRFTDMCGRNGGEWGGDCLKSEIIMSLITVYEIIASH